MTAELVPMEENGQLPAWAATFTAVASVAGELARTPFVPASLRVMDDGRLNPGATAANVAAAILTGGELDMAPMAALRSIAVIDGTPALSALALRALVQSRGHGVWVVEATSARAVVEGLRHGDPGDRTQRITWTMDDAKARRLDGRFNWRTQPRNMLIARATAEVCRLIAADVVLGLPYAVEELEDGDDPDPPPPPPPAKRTAKRVRQDSLPPAAAADGDGGPSAEVPVAGGSDSPGLVPNDRGKDGAPTVPREPAPGGTPPPGPPGGGVVLMSDEQRKAMMASYRGLGITDRAERLRDCSAIVGRTVTSLAAKGDLTFGEAHQILAELELRKARGVPPPGVGQPQERSGDLGPEEHELGEDEPSFEESPLFEAP